MNDQNLGYSKIQQNAAKGFYIAIVLSWIIIITGSVWTVIDFLNPSGKLDYFLSLNPFYQVVIVGGFLAGFFFLLVFIFLYTSKNML